MSQRYETKLTYDGVGEYEDNNFPDITWVFEYCNADIYHSREQNLYNDKCLHLTWYNNLYSDLISDIQVSSDVDAVFEYFKDYHRNDGQFPWESDRS